LGDSSLAARADEVVALLSATRAELRTDLLHNGDTPEKIAWDHSVLEAHPLLRMPDGRLRLSSPRSLIAWMTRGMHYRLLDAAGHGLAGEAAKESRGLFLTYVGALGQEYVRRLVDASTASMQKAGTIRLLPEIEYRVGKRRMDSTDVGLDAGTDLMLFEVYAGRMGIPARTGAAPKTLSEFVNRATGKKLVELADRTRELLAGDLAYADLDLTRVRRVFPIVVLAGEPLIQHPLLWGLLRAEFPAAWLEDARVQAPLLLDLDDLEAFMALAEQGHHLPDLLAAFLASDESEDPPRSWLVTTYGDQLRPSYVEHRARAAFESARKIMYPASAG
jgi:hypothetical protein